MSERLASNMKYFMLQYALTFAIGILYSFIMAKILLPGEYGKIITTTNIMQLFALFTTLGMGAATAKLVSQYHGTSNAALETHVARYALKVILVCNALLALACIVFSSQLQAAFKISPELLALSVFGAVAISVNGIFGSVLYGRQEIRKMALTEVASSVSRIILFLALVAIGMATVGPVIAFAASIAVMAALRFDPRWFAKAPQAQARESESTVRSYAIPAFFSDISNSAYNSLQYLVVPVILDQAAAGLAALSLRIASFLMVIPGTLSASLFPIVSKLSGSGPSAETDSHINRAIIYILAIVVPVNIGIALYSKEFLLAVSRPEYLAISNAMPLFVLGASLLFLQNFATQNLYALNHPKTSRNVSLFGAVCYIALAVWLVPMMGASGMAAAQIAVASVCSAGGLALLSKHVSFAHIRAKIAPLALSLGVFAVATLAARAFVGPQTALAVTATAGAGAYLAALFAFGAFDSVDKQFFHSLYSTAAARIGGLINKARSAGKAKK